jgi:hypothetical protein
VRSGRRSRARLGLAHVRRPDGRVRLHRSHAGCRRRSRGCPIRGRYGCRLAERIGIRISASTPWDNPFNRAMNQLKNKDKPSKPSSAGRVAGHGLSTKWGEYYKDDGKQRKNRRSGKDSREVKELKEKLAQLPQLVEEQVRDQVGKTLTAILPSLLEGLREWNKGGQQGPTSIPSVMGSNTHNARYWCLRRRRYWRLMHPVGRIRRPTPRQQASPPSLARPTSAMP